jgi:hypothetical protein
MEHYFLAKHLCNIIIENLNETFIDSLNKDYNKYDDISKELIKNIIKEIMSYLYISNNDLLSSINSKNKAYYITLQNNIIKYFVIFLENDNNINKEFIRNLIKYYNYSEEYFNL